MVANLRLSERNLILTGYTGPNQPRIGQRLAEQLRMPLLDLDRQIEDRIGDTPEVIRQRYGEQRLKTVVNEMMQEVMLRRQTVIRVNSSTLLYGDHFENLQDTGPVICMVARLDAILRRLHLQLGARYHDPAQRGRALGELHREWRVRSLPGIHELDVTYMDENQIIESVIALWQELAILRA